MTEDAGKLLNDTGVNQPLKSPRKVDKERLDRADKASRIMMESEREAREAKTARLKQQRLARETNGT